MRVMRKGGMAVGICAQCGGRFEYEFAGRRKRICPDCFDQNEKKAYGRARARLKTVAGERDNEANWSVLEEVAKVGRDEIAKQFGITAQAVREGERNALFRIRRNPELRRLFGLWISEGCPVVDRGTDHGTDGMLDWQLGVGEMYLAYDRLCAAGLVAEAAKCLAEISKFQSELGKVIMENAKKYE